MAQRIGMDREPQVLRKLVLEEHGPGVRATDELIGPLLRFKRDLGLRLAAGEGEFVLEEEAVKAVEEAGGVPVRAHPGPHVIKALGKLRQKPGAQVVPRKSGKEIVQGK